VTLTVLKQTMAGVLQIGVVAQGGEYILQGLTLAAAHMHVATGSNGAA
jgi:hypothetical protein